MAKAEDKESSLVAAANSRSGASAGLSQDVHDGLLTCRTRLFDCRRFLKTNHACCPGSWPGNFWNHNGLDESLVTFQDGLFAAW